MSISLVLTVNNRTPEVSRRVAESFRLPGNQPDEVIVVLDRPTQEAKAGALAAYYDLAPQRGADPGDSTRFVELEGPPGWLCPARAWNAGFAAATSEFLYCISSEVVQEPGNLDTARALLATDPNTVLHGRCTCSCGPEGKEVDWLGTAPGNLLCDAAHPRPLGFIWAGPRRHVLDIGGFDLEYMKGLWYDETDFFYRLWKTGLSFTFTNNIQGTHLHHDRPDLDTSDGAARIARNRAYTLQQYRTLDPWPTTPRINSWSPDGSLTWRHL